MNTEMMSIETIGKLLEALYNIKNGNYNKQLGICNNVNSTIKICLEHLIDGWEYHSGNFEYPIPPNKDSNLSPDDTYYHFLFNGGLWEGEQLAYRMSLVEYLIKRIEDGVKR